ncbi:MAG: hypothetical protein R3E89_04065 [Thiolinea sp.]
MLGLFLAAGLICSGRAVFVITDPPANYCGGHFYHSLLVFLVILYISGNSQGAGSELFIYLSHFGHFLSFLEGIFDSSDLVYYLLFIGGFLLLTIRKLNDDRLRG